MSNVRGGSHQDGIVSGFGQEIKGMEDDGADLRTCAVVEVPISLLPASEAVDLIALSGVIGVVSGFRTAVAIQDPCLTTWAIYVGTITNSTPLSGHVGRQNGGMTTNLEDIGSHGMNTGGISGVTVKIIESRSTA